MVEDICIHPWDYAVEPFKIAGGLYYVGNRDVSSHLIDTGDGLILLDTTFPQTVYLLLESIWRLGFNPADIHTILHTHGHYDHFGGTRAIVELTGAKTAMGEDDAFILNERTDLSWGPEYGVDFHETFKLDLPLHDGETLTIGNTEVECVHTPGHTPGSISYFFNISDGTNKYKAGIYSSPGLNTLTDEYLTQYGLSYDVRDNFLTSLMKIKGRPVDILLGTHAEYGDVLDKRKQMEDGRNPFIDIAAWPTFISNLETSAKEEFGMVKQDISPRP